MSDTDRQGRKVVALGAAILALLAIAVAGMAAEPAPARQQALKRAGERADKITDKFQRTWAWYAIAEETAATDPAAAAELSDKLESWTAKRDLLGIVMYAWGKTDPPAAADWGVKFKERTSGNLDTKNTALRCAVVGMVWKDPKLADDLIWKHLQDEGWGGFPRTAPMLQEGLIGPRTTVVAHHFSHNGGLTHTALVDKFAPHDVTVAYDGLTFVL